MASRSLSRNSRRTKSSSFSSLRLIVGALLLVLSCIWLILHSLAQVTPNNTEGNTSPLKNQNTADFSASTLSRQQLPSLSELTNTYDQHDKQACEAKSFVYIPNVIKAAVDADDAKGTSVNTHNRIPKIIHQTSKSRCMTKMFARVSKRWRNDLPGYDYYFHDDSSMIRLLTTHMDEFPLLYDLVQANCLRHGTIKADVWRYLVLWTYGGIYADIDTQPTALFFNNTTLFQAASSTDTIDGWFVVEQFHVLSQYVMAVSPRHPLMYYAIQHATNKLILQVDTGRINAALVTGPHALHRAYQDFRKDAGVNVDPQGPGYKPVWAGTFVGTNQRSITVVGRGENEGEYITREMMTLPMKKKQYAKMNMTSFHDDKTHPSGQSCLSALYQYHHHHRQQQQRSN